MNKKKVYPYYMMIVPFIVFLVVFVVPSTVGLLYAFTDWSAYIDKVKFVGLKNFAEIVMDKSLLKACVNTIIYAGVKTVIVTVLGFVFAIPLNRKLKTRNALRTVYYLPAILSTLVVGLIFNALFDYRHGVVNVMLQAAGMENLIFKWLGSRWPGVFTICLAEVWRNVGYALVITLAGLQSVSSDYIEAAKVDGAKSWQLFWRITLPLIMPTVNVNILFSLIYGLKMFDLVFVMTGGGPGHDTETFGTLMVNEMSRGRYSQSVAINFVFTIILIVVAIAYNRISRRWENVE